MKELRLIETAMKKKLNHLKRPRPPQSFDKRVYCIEKKIEALWIKAVTKMPAENIPLIDIGLISSEKARRIIEERLKKGI